MKKQYKKPTVEKINFDYVESVVACPSGCSDPTHWDHQGHNFGTCGWSSGFVGGSQGSNQGNNQGGNQGSNQGGTNSGNSYYAPGWGLNC